jgi:hypothetical protein
MVVLPLLHLVGSSCIDAGYTLGVAEMQQLAILIDNVPRVDPPAKAHAIKSS